MKHAANAKQGLQNCQQKETVIDPKIQQIQALNATPTPTTQPYGSKASNRLFAALPLSDWTRWTGHLEMVELKLGEEVTGLKQSYKDLHLNYSETLTSLKGLTLHACEAAKRAVKAAENAAHASTCCANAAKEAAQASVVSAAELAAQAASASAQAAMEAAASAAAAAAATAMAVAHHAEDASAQASATAAMATQMATEAAAHAVSMSNAAAEYARSARAKAP